MSTISNATELMDTRMNRRPFISPYQPIRDWQRHIRREVPGGLHAHGNSFANGNTIIGVNVIGNGTINEFQANSSGKLEFAHSWRARDGHKPDHGLCGRRITALSRSIAH